MKQASWLLQWLAGPHGSLPPAGPTHDPKNVGGEGFTQKPSGHGAARRPTAVGQSPAQSGFQKSLQMWTSTSWPSSGLPLQEASLPAHLGEGSAGGGRGERQDA